MNAQRLRNITTGRLHTEMGHIYEDLGTITGESGLMTHMLPRAMRAVEPWLREHVTDPRFWDREYDVTHTGEIELPEPTEQDRAEMFERYKAMPNPLAGKDVVVIQANVIGMAAPACTHKINQTASSASPSPTCSTSSFFFGWRSW